MCKCSATVGTTIVMCANSHNSSCTPAFSTTVDVEHNCSATAEQLSWYVRTPIKRNGSRRRGQLLANNRSTENCMCALGLWVRYTISFIGELISFNSLSWKSVLTIIHCNVNCRQIAASHGLIKNKQTKIKGSIFWDVVPRSLLKVTRRFRRTCHNHFHGWSASQTRSHHEADSKQRNAVACSILISCLANSSALKMEAIYSSETFVYFQWITQCYIPEDRILQIIVMKRLKSYKNEMFRTHMRAGFPEWFCDCIMTLFHLTVVSQSINWEVEMIT
jgi:hypothetical protein